MKDTPLDKSSPKLGPSSRPSEYLSPQQLLLMASAIQFGDGEYGDAA